MEPEGILNGSKANVLRVKAIKIAMKKVLKLSSQ